MYRCVCVISANKMKFYSLISSLLYDIQPMVVVPVCDSKTWRTLKLLKNDPLDCRNVLE